MMIASLADFPCEAMQVIAAAAAAVRNGDLSVVQKTLDRWQSPSPNCDSVQIKSILFDEGAVVLAAAGQDSHAELRISYRHGYVLSLNGQEQGYEYSWAEGFPLHAWRTGNPQDDSPSRTLRAIARWGSRNSVYMTGRLRDLSE